jgi:hypothetical protein
VVRRETLFQLPFSGSTTALRAAMFGKKSPRMSDAEAKYSSIKLLGRGSFGYVDL